MLIQDRLVDRCFQFLSVGLSEKLPFPTPGPHLRHNITIVLIYLLGYTWLSDFRDQLSQFLWCFELCLIFLDLNQHCAWCYLYSLFVCINTYMHTSLIYYYQPDNINIIQKIHIIISYLEIWTSFLPRCMFIIFAQYLHIASNSFNCPWRNEIWVSNSSSYNQK